MQSGASHRWWRAGGGAERHKVAARRQAVQGCLERVFAHRVKHHGHAGATGDLFDARGNVFGAPVNAELVAIGLGQSNFVCAACHADHACSQVLSPLPCEQAHAACGGVHQNELPGLDRIAALHQVLHRHAFEHAGRQLLVRYEVG